MPNNNVCNNDGAKLLADFPNNKLNKMVRGLEGTMLCDRECQRKKKMEQYKDKWQKSINEYNKLPNKIEGYEKNYIKMSKGDDAYDSMKDEQFKSDANSFKTNELNKLYEVKNQLDGLLISNQTLESYESQQTRIVKIVKQKNEALKKDIDDKKYSIVTNERRVYYENNGLTSLTNIKFYLYILYWIVLPILIVTYIFAGPFFPKKEYKNYIRLIILLLIYILFAIPQFLTLFSRALTESYYKIVRALNF